MMKRGATFRGVLLGAAVLVGGGLVSSVAAQPGQMPDPRRMSGIPRPDPQVPAGEITVRCLLGGFSEPAVGIEVQLDLQAPDGTSLGQRLATTDAQGRATFTDLGAHTGGRAVARATLDGQEVRSLPIEVVGAMGSRVLLVKGAASAQSSPMPAAPPAAGGPHGAGHGASSDVPPPGQPFAIEGHPAGTLVVGTLDLRGQGKARAVDVELSITPPPGQGEPSTRTARSDDQGRAVFDGLVPPAVPQGSALQVSAQIDPDGEPQTSVSFQLTAPAMAVYLAEGFDAASPGHGGAGVAHGDGNAPAGPAPVPGPRVAPDLGPDVVRVRVIDGADAPVANQVVEVWKKNVTHDDERFVARTDATGTALVEGITIEGNAAYFVGVPYDGAPYQSPFFQLTGRQGVAVDMRVFPVTGDLADIRSVAQFQLLARENDHVQVFHFLQVMVRGDHAFWPKEGLEIHGGRGAKGLKIHPRAGEWLEEVESAPFARLSGPIAPGTMADLSVVYLLEHDGDVELEWTTPFALADATAVLPQDLELAEPRLDPEALPEGAQHSADVRLFRMGERPAGSTIELTVSGLPVRPRVFRWLGLGTAGLLSLGLLIGLVKPRKTRVERLRERKQLLLAQVANASGDDRARLVRALDRIYRELDALADRGG